MKILSLAALTACPVDDGYALPGVVDEELLARAVVLAHNEVDPLGKAPVVLAELAVLVHFGPIGPRALRRGHLRRGWEHTRLELSVVELFWERPRQLGHLGPSEIVARRRRRHHERARSGVG